MYDLDTVDGLAESAFNDVPNGAALPFFVINTGEKKYKAQFNELAVRLENLQ